MNEAPAATGAETAADGNSNAEAGPLDQLRQHPQFDQLRQLVQANPQALPAVLQQIGQQDPTLLGLIQANQQAFVAMMNEPQEPAVSSLPAQEPSVANGPSPAQLAQMMGNLSPEQQQQMAAAMGMDPAQLQAVTQMMSQVPPEALAQIMGRAGAPGMGMGQEQDADGPGTIRLTEEEGAAVD